MTLKEKIEEMIREIDDYDGYDLYKYDEIYQDIYISGIEKGLELINNLMESFNVDCELD